MNYKDDMKWLESLLAEMWTHEESHNKEDWERADEVQYSYYQSNFEKKLDSKDESDISVVILAAAE